MPLTSLGPALPSAQHSRAALRGSGQTVGPARSPARRGSRHFAAGRRREPPHGWCCGTAPGAAAVPRQPAVPGLAATPAGLTAFASPAPAPAPGARALSPAGRRLPPLPLPPPPAPLASPASPALRGVTAASGRRSPRERRAGAAPPPAREPFSPQCPRLSRCPWKAERRDGAGRHRQPLPPAPAPARPPAFAAALARRCCDGPRRTGLFCPLSREMPSVWLG